MDVMKFLDKQFSTIFHRGLSLYITSSGKNCTSQFHKTCIFQNPVSIDFELCTDRWLFNYRRSSFRREPSIIGGWQLTFFLVAIGTSMKFLETVTSSEAFVNFACPIFIENASWLRESRPRINWLKLCGLVFLWLFLALPARVSRQMFL